MFLDVDDLHFLNQPFKALGRSEHAEQFISVGIGQGFDGAQVDDDHIAGRDGTYDIGSTP